MMILIQGNAVHAYFVAIPKDQGAIDFNRPTRFLIPGRGTDLNLQPQLSALGRAQLYQRNFKNDQIVLLSVFENKTNEAGLLAAGWQFIKKNNLHFETDVILSELKQFSRIRSMDFFGHNSPSLGTQTDGLGFRFDFRKPGVKELTPLFDKDAFVIIHGCNSGWLIATEMAKIWNIAVAGSFTGTRFEHLHSDGHFYVYDKSKAPDSQWAKVNRDLEGVPCSAGGCIRMRPAFSVYNGKWGNFNGPLLSHHKFFCPLEVKECEKRMALSLYGYLGEQTLRPQSDDREFRTLAKEYLCPVYKDRKVTEDCLQQLALVDQGQQSNNKVHYVVNNKQLQCDLSSCKAKMTCDDHICSVSFDKTSPASTLIQEYIHFINGYQWLHQESF